MLTRFVCDLALDGADRDVRRLKVAAGERWWRETSAEQLEGACRALRETSVRWRDLRPGEALTVVRGPCRRARLGRARVQLSPTYVAWDGYEQEMAAFTAGLKASPSGALHFAGVRARLDEHGMSVDADRFLGRPDACVALISRALQPTADRVDPRYVFAGPCVDETRTAGWAPTDTGNGRPLAYVAFGTAYTDKPDVCKAAVDALAGDRRVVLATGKVDPAVLGPLPDSVQAARTQPQLDVLAHADVFVTHAGMGSAAESLWFGVPTVAIPQAVDQFTHAVQLEACGAGVHLPDEQVTADTLRAAIADAASRAPRPRQLREEVRRTGGVVAAADAVERPAAGA